MLLITIVLAVAIPQFKTGVLQDPTKKLSRWMITTVKTLRGLSIEKQEIQTLVIDVDRNRMYTVSADMSEENLSAAAEKAFKLPGDLRIVDIVFPDKEHDASGTAQISFYPAGFSDQALIRLENGHAERFAYMIEPLLPKIKFLEEWPSF